MLTTSFHDVMNNLHIQISSGVSLEHITAVLILRATIPKDRATAFRLRYFWRFIFCPWKGFWISRDSVYGTRWTNPPFPSLMMLRSYEPQRFWVTNSTFPCDHQNQLDKPSLMYCVTWLCKLFSLSYDLFRRFYKLEPKLVNVTN